MSEQTKEMIDAIKAVSGDKEATSKTVLVMVTDFLSVMDERLSGLERIVEKLDSSRDGAGSPGGLSIG